MNFESLIDPGHPVEVCPPTMTMTTTRVVVTRTRTVWYDGLRVFAASGFCSWAGLEGGEVMG